jgi:apolipoprotein N-acyltransferase
VAALWGAVLAQWWGPAGPGPWRCWPWRCRWRPRWRLGFHPPDRSLTVSLLQPNVPQDIKFDPNRLAGNMLALREQVLAAPGQLVLTPESVLAVPQADLDPAYWQSLIQPFTRGERAVLMGTFLGNDQRAMSIRWSACRRRACARQAYATASATCCPWRIHPAGLPLVRRPDAHPAGRPGPGPEPGRVRGGGQRVRPLICYEDLFGEDFADSLVGPQSPTVLANASNLAWFGRWMMQDQHLQFSRMRALEFQRPLVRSTNTGATAAIDHHGVVLRRLPAWTPGRLDVTVEGRRASRPMPLAGPLAPAAAVAAGLLAGLPALAGAAQRRTARSTGARNPKWAVRFPASGPAGARGAVPPRMPAQRPA